MTPAPSPRHQKISQRLEMLLVSHLQSSGHGEVYDAPIDVVLDDHTVVQPDLLFVRRERADIVRDDGIHGPPDLVVEVLSPSTRRHDVVTKLQLYARAGVPLYWIVDPEADRLERFRLRDHTYEPLSIDLAPAVVEPPEVDGVRIDLAEQLA